MQTGNHTQGGKAGVSIIMVNFNGGGILLESVEAALSSSVPVQLLIFDNGSEDGSIQRLRERFPRESRLKIHVNSRNLGFSTAVNQGLLKAEFEYLLILNPDCLIGNDTLKRMIESLEQYPAAGMAGCLILNPDGTEQRGCRRHHPNVASGLVKALSLARLGGMGRNAMVMDRNTEALPKEPVFVEAISGAFMLVHRRALDSVGPLDENYFLHCEDLDWCKRFELEGWKILFVPGVSVLHHQGVCSDNRPLRVAWHKHRGMIRYYRKFLFQEYPRYLSWLVYGGILGRFTIVSITIVARQLFAKKSAA